jgi:hypothetical protein
MILTYRYRVKDRSAKKTLRRHAKACNIVWNYCNEVQRYDQPRFGLWFAWYPVCWRTYGYAKQWVWLRTVQRDFHVCFEFAFKDPKWFDDRGLMTKAHQELLDAEDRVHAEHGRP